MLASGNAMQEAFDNIMLSSAKAVVTAAENKNQWIIDAETILLAKIDLKRQANWKSLSVPQCVYILDNLLKLLGCSMRGEVIVAEFGGLATDAVKSLQGHYARMSEEERLEKPPIPICVQQKCTDRVRQLIYFLVGFKGGDPFPKHPGGEKLDLKKLVQFAVGFLKVRLQSGAVTKNIFCETVAGIVGSFVAENNLYMEKNNDYKQEFLRRANAQAFATAASLSGQAALGRSPVVLALENSPAMWGAGKDEKEQEEEDMKETEKDKKDGDEKSKDQKDKYEKKYKGKDNDKDRKRGKYRKSTKKRKARSPSTSSAPTSTSSSGTSSSSQPTSAPKKRQSKKKKVPSRNTRSKNRKVQSNINPPNGVDEKAASIMKEPLVEPVPSSPTDLNDEE